RIGERDVGQVDRRLLADEAALLRSALALMAGHHVDPAHERPVLLGHDLDHLAGATLVAAGDDDHLVALPDARGHYRTSGASEMIFMWFLARSSRGTGPKMRVPTGSALLSISTAALLSKRITLPSGRRISLAVR